LNEYAKRWENGHIHKDVATCSVCKKTLPATYEYFNRDKRKKHGLTSYCKKCANRKNAEFSQKPENKERIKQKKALHNSKPEVKVRIKERAKLYYLENKDRLAKQSKEYRSNPEVKAKSKKRAKEYQAKPEVRAWYRKRDNKLRKNDPNFRLSRNISSSMYQALKGNKNHIHWEKLVDFTLDDLKKHLKKQFQPGMTFENYGKWHLDHKIPRSVFNFKTPDDLDFKRCWCLENLAPMWAKENISKGNKLEKPFQPSLAFG
jgi:nucleoid DNA-binding protein